jgi:hypothetical protein
VANPRHSSASQIAVTALIAKGARAAVRAVVDALPDETLEQVGVRRHGGTAASGPVIGAFLVGASIGALALLAVAPGGHDMRRLLASRLRHARDVALDAESDVEDQLARVRDRARAIVTGRAAAPFDPSRPSDGPAAG